MNVFVLKNIVMLSKDGKYFRATKSPVAEYMKGCLIALVLKGHGGPLPVGILTEINESCVTIQSPTHPQILHVKTSKIYGWIPLDLLTSDLENEELQAHPEDWCNPGFDKQGIAVV